MKVWTKDAVAGVIESLESIRELHDYLTAQDLKGCIEKGSEEADLLAYLDAESEKGRL